MTNEELAREVAVKVMKFTGPYQSVVEAFALDWESAGRVIEKMRAAGWDFEVTTFQGVYCAMFTKDDHSGGDAESDNAPRAIFLAALRAKEAAK